jgi:hypothetical protein
MTPQRPDASRSDGTDRVRIRVIGTLVDECVHPVLVFTAPRLCAHGLIVRLPAHTSIEASLNLQTIQAEQRHPFTNLARALQRDAIRRSSSATRRRIRVASCRLHLRSGRAREMLRRLREYAEDRE